jgi:hypothetical protein
MTPSRGGSGIAVGFASFFLVVSIGVFGVMFYYLDGVGLLRDLYDDLRGRSGSEITAPRRDAPESEQLVLPAGMSEEFALALWQAQMGSQEVIGRLANGDVSSLRVDSAVSDDESATLECTLFFEDDSDRPCVVTMRRFEDSWYLSTIRTLDDQRAPLPSSPTVEGVDFAMLSALVAGNADSQPVLRSLADGVVTEVFMEAVNAGPRSVTIEVEMEQEGGLGFANFVAIQGEPGGRTQWLLVLFEKTGSYPPEL